MRAYDFSKKGNLKLYEYLYECLKKDILTGKIGAGEKLPSKREMAALHEISVKTVENAYAQLLAEGYLEAEEKRGYFAARVEQMEYHRKKQPPEEVPDFLKPQNWFADFTSSNTVCAKFPFSQWSRAMRETLSYRDAELLETAPFQGVTVLRKQIAEYLYRNRGMSVSPDHILVGAGTEYLYSRLLGLLKEIHVYAVEDPGYRKIVKIYEGQGAECRYIPVDGEGMCVEALEKSGADAVHVSPGYHFPLGTVMPIGRRQALLAWAAEKPNRYIIEDDFDCEFRYSGRPIPSIQSMDSNHRVIYLNTFSKTLAPSLRISYMVLPEKLMERYVQRMNYYSNTVSSFEQYALASFMEKGYFERHINKMRKYYREYRDKIRQILNESGLPILGMNGDEAGTRILVKLDTVLTDTQIKWAAGEAGIHLECLSEFCREYNPAYEHVLILNFADLSEEVLREAIFRLAHIFNSSLPY